jgi:hypothetical protein
MSDILGRAHQIELRNRSTSFAQCQEAGARAAERRRRVDTEPPLPGNGADPDASAEAMKAKFAELDDGLDIPECLRREPKAAAS